MKLQVHKALGKPNKATVWLSLAVRSKIGVAPGYCVRVRGSSERIAKNFIVCKTRSDDPLIGLANVIRMDANSRERVGVNIGDTVEVQCLSYSTWFHGTRIADPTVIVEHGWIVGPGAACGPGVYLTSDRNVASAYAATAMITAQVAWGNDLNQIFHQGSMLDEFKLFCRERGEDCDAHVEAYRTCRIDPVIFQWARWCGHFLPGGDTIHVFPGPIGTGFKPNLIRIQQIFARNGRVLFDRGRAPDQIE
jgi:hypothetical protein